MRTRSQLEELENKILEPYAVKSSESQGRQFKEKEHDYRTPFQRDRDRIIHTSAFRRLEYKTQVFVNHEGDYYRTRLTHTLEVSQIAKTIARALGLNEDLSEAICLAHDLGHTPFGHSGQDIMSELMKDHGGFEHNKQSFRIVTFLERRYTQFVGLNLTYEVLEGITKHASEYDLPDGTIFLKEGYPSIEAQICNFADEIAYNNHDIDDGLKSGLLLGKDLEKIAIWNVNFAKVMKDNPDADHKQQRRITVKSIINHLVTDLIDYTNSQIAALKLTSHEDVKLRGKDVVGFSPEVRKLNAELKKFLFKKLYRHYRVERMAEKAKKVISDLFTAYTKNPNTLPSDFKESYDQATVIERIVCDYIAGMTDRFALAEYSKLFDPFSKV